MESNTLESALEDLFFATNGSIKGILNNWHDIMYKVKIAKMGRIYLPIEDIRTINEALAPIKEQLSKVNLLISERLRESI